MSTTDLYNSYRDKMRTIADIKNASAVLQWDQETYLPPKGAQLRGQQITTLTEISHKLFSEPELGKLLEELNETMELSPFQKRNVERTLEDYKRNKKYTPEFVRKLSEQVNKTFHAWIHARKQNDYKVYQKDLSELIQLKKQETDLLGYEGHPYNALLDEYEKGATTQLIDHTFSGLLPQLKQLVEDIRKKPQVDNSFLKQYFPKDRQWEWSMDLIRRLNYDFEAGRQDLSEHPFSVSFNPNDVRITTRVDEGDISNMTWSCIHETGHALYEQGLPEEAYGLPLGEACSYSIHESQSRLWENNVGRAIHIWKNFYPLLQQYFPAQLGKISLEDFYKGINKVEPSLIRTEADEITYHFHVYIRYELEKKLITGELDAPDIPTFWNEQYLQLLGVRVPDDKRGCLQDVHWSHGSFGYFPTYSLGSFYAAQFYDQAKKEIQDLELHLETGQSAQLLLWLREKIHRKGRYHTSEDLCREITGKGLDVTYFINHILQKYVSIYTL